MPRSSTARMPAAALGLLVLATAWTGPLPVIAHDLFSVHMMQHVLVMNVAARLFAAAWPAAVMAGGAPWLVVVAGLQVAALAGWHAPPVVAATHHDVAMQVLMQVSLFAVALLFWRTVLARRGRHAWPSIIALLVNAKVLCLLGVVLVFAQRPLYGAHGVPERWGLSALADQQFAGLAMIASCTLFYVATAMSLFVGWYSEIAGGASVARHAA
jgi:putative membrane protein